MEALDSIFTAIPDNPELKRRIVEKVTGKSFYGHVVVVHRQDQNNNDEIVIFPRKPIANSRVTYLSLDSPSPKMHSFSARVIDDSLRSYFQSDDLDGSLADLAAAFIAIREAIKQQQSQP
jgi:hypothetical protein